MNKINHRQISKGNIMNLFRFILTIMIASMFSSALAIRPITENTVPNKAQVIDGHVVHNMGQLTNHVTNWGLIGSRPAVPSWYSDAPSATWPAGSENDYLSEAGLWVGGMVLGERLVSTATIDFEIQPALTPGDTIFCSSRGTLGGTRFPWPGADDDGDGLEDEDPLDGIDNDNDGLTDEDFAGIGDQGFYCSMTDISLLSFENNPTHTPLNISVKQQTFQWDDPLADDFIGYQYTIKNIGVTQISQVYCGLYSDFDIAPRSMGGAGAGDDLAGSFNGQVRTSDGTYVSVSLAYMRDGAADQPLPGWVGWVMCGLETDAEAGLPENPLSLPTMQIFSGNNPFEQGGDPTNDSERYQLLSAGSWDAEIAPDMSDDYRLVIAAQGLTTLEVDESLTFSVALVIGDDLADLLGNAAEAVLIAMGKSYDRDGDPANGDEFHVPWLLIHDYTSPVLPSAHQTITLHEATPNPFNPQTTIAFDLPEQTNVTLRVYDMSGRLVDILMNDETATEGRNEVLWNGRDLTGRVVSAGVYFYSLESASFRETKRMTLVK